MNYFKKRHFVLLSFLLMLAFLCSACASPSTPQIEPPLKDTRFMMGTVITLSLYDQQDQAILDKAFQAIKNLENDLSLNSANTLLDEVNANAGIVPTVVNDQMFEVVERGLYYSQLTEGSFDISVGPLVKLWNIGFPEARVPSQEEIHATLPLINYQNVQLDPSKHTILLKEPGMKLDLGSIAKGYAADEIARILRAEGVNHALIDLGGNVFTLGTKPDGSSWKVGIQDPFNPRGEIVGFIPVVNKSIVTSGIYERYLEVDGKSYHHILNPHTGYPFENDIAGVTIISDFSIDGDALSTSVFSRGIEEGIAFVNALKGIEAIFISKDYHIYLTDGIREDFVLGNDSFTIVEP